MRLFPLAQKQILFGLLELTQMFIVCKSEWTSSNLLKWFHLYPCLNEAVLITQIVSRLLEFTQMFLIASKFHWSSCIGYHPNWMKILPNLIWLKDFTQMFPIYVNAYNFTQIWIKLSSFAQIYLKLLDHTQMFLILPKTWIMFFNWPKLDEGYWNSQMILVQEVTILLSDSVYFAVRGKKEWQSSLSKAFAVDGNTDNTSLKCECSCIICPNVQNFCPKNTQFSIVRDATASPASPCRTLMPVTIGHFGTLLHPYSWFCWPLFFLMCLVLLPTSLAKRCHGCCIES